MEGVRLPRSQEISRDLILPGLHCFCSPHLSSALVEVRSTPTSRHQRSLTMLSAAARPELYPLYMVPHLGDMSMERWGAGSVCAGADVAVAERLVKWQLEGMYAKRSLGLALVSPRFVLVGAPGVGEPDVYPWDAAGASGGVPTLVCGYACGKGATWVATCGGWLVGGGVGLVAFANALASGVKHRVEGAVGMSDGGVLLAVRVWVGGWVFMLRAGVSQVEGLGHVAVFSPLFSPLPVPSQRPMLAATPPRPQVAAPQPPPAPVQPPALPPAPPALAPPPASDETQQNSLVFNLAAPEGTLPLDLPHLLGSIGVRVVCIRTRPGDREAVVTFESDAESVYGVRDTNRSLAAFEIEWPERGLMSEAMGPSWGVWRNKSRRKRGGWGGREEAAGPRRVGGPNYRAEGPKRKKGKKGKGKG